MKRADRDAPRPKSYFGKYAGTVLTNTPADGAHRGELEVEVPGILEDDPDTRGAHRPFRAWARPCLPPGHFVLPPVGHPVWVEFAAGRLEEPIWTGVWYADPAKAPAKGPPQDHEAAAPTESDWIIAAHDGCRLVLRDGHGNAVVLADGSVRVESAGALSIVGKGGISLQAGGSMAIKAKSVTINDEPVVLAPFVEAVVGWLMAHKHLGNMGGPAPLDPGDLGTLQPDVGQKPGIVADGMG